MVSPPVYAVRMAVLVQVVGALLLVAAVAVWSWPVALGLAGVLLIAGGALAESQRRPELKAEGSR